MVVERPRCCDTSACLLPAQSVSLQEPRRFCVLENVGHLLSAKMRDLFLYVLEAGMQACPNNILVGVM